MSDSTFEHIRTDPIPTLRIEVEEYRHRETGAKHFHLKSEDNNNAFMVAFLTVPQDSTGVAHILEHTSLCGSKRFPVRDPFFMMTRRSLNTFMNAFTSSDWTAYPFASQNRKDFNNLLDVYLDATFFPTLDALDFAQEGHRVEFAEPDNPDSDLVYKGVVFNEMKGAMSSPIRTVWQTLQTELFPTITYHHNSGGEPENIPDLSYEQLKAFHALHYHPSNAVFMTYGDIPAVEHQAIFEAKALSQFEYKQIDLAVPQEQRYDAPRSLTRPYALDGESETTKRTHVNVGWLLGQNTDLMAMMEAHLLSGVLLDNSASPLRHALEVTDLGASPSELCGMDDSTKEMVFVCGVEGSEPEHAEKIENMILGVLEEIAEQGVPREQVEAVLHQVELSQREVGGGHFPYGLQLMVNALNPAIHGGDPVAVLNLDPVLESLRQSIQDDDYIKGLVRRQLLDNPHRVRLVMQPDPEMSARKAAEEAQRLAELKAKLNDNDKAEIVRLAAELNERQMQQDDPEVLPKVTLDDVPDELKIAKGSQTQIAGFPATWFSQGTNGLVYQQLVVDMPELPEELIELFPVFCDALPEVGVGDLDYLQAQNWQAAVTGGIGARTSVRSRVGDVSQTK
ncbi:MAG: insulinase family protein, partial [Gammaproteobacteria bacterium]